MPAMRRVVSVRIAKVSGEYMTPEEVLTEVLKDQPFYRNSGGGVTISGGEPLLQSEFVSRLLELCKTEGLHTALDTTAYVPWEVMGPVLRDVDLILFDGQGIAHPRSMGLATHVGLVTDMPSIGCAKSVLFGSYDEPGASKGEYTYLFDKEDNKIGAALRTRTNVKPVYVSPGHRIDIETSIDFVLSCVTKFRIPEPLRLAHKMASEWRG